MSDIKSIDFDHDGIGHFISDHRLEVPFYQRPFAWEEEHVIALFQDILDAMRTQKEYFIGTIVVSRKENEETLEVVDGQQRLATITILLSAMRDHFLLNKDSRRVEHLEKTYLRTYVMTDDDYKAKFKLSDNDNDFFYNTIVKPFDETSSVSKSEKDSHKRIQQAYKNAQQYVKRLVDLSKWKN